jgi:hypothetical protein
MQQWTRRAAGGTGAAALAVGVALATAPAASAAPPNSAAGVAAVGIIPANPFAVSTYPGTSPNHVGSINLPPLLSTGVVDTAAGPTSASAVVSGLNVAVSALASLSAGTLTSSCSYNPATGAVSASGDVENGTITLLGAPIALSPHPAPNTTIALPGILSLTLNAQTTAPDGTLTVSALTVSLLGSAETVSIAKSVCNAATLA